LVERGIPMIQEHLNLASQIRNEIGGPVAAANRPDTQAAAGAPQPTTPWENVKPDQPRNQPADTHTVSQQDQAAAAAGARGTGDITKEKQFVINVANHHFLEKQLGELAARKGQNNQVKQYGQKAAKDHAEMEQAWIKMANNNGMNIQSGMGPEHRKKLTQLEKKSGKSFDKDYMSMEVSNHKGYLNALLKEGKGASSSDVREIVDRQIPVETEHFNLAKQIGGQVDADTAAQLRTTSAK
jgi:putative membrane protein